MLKKTVSRFKDTAYSGVFRSDGRMLAAGGQDGTVQLFDAASRSVLRQFKAHKRPAHVVRFAPDKLHVLSGSDDVTARWWDIASGAQVLRLTGHGDYVRAAACSPANMETWATGSYDHTCKLWDVRSGEAMMSLDHGAPVEDVAFFPAGSLVVSVGGNSVCVWDVLSGGKLLRRLTNFQKTVACVRLSPMAGPDSAAAPRMLTGSLDGHVKVFELDGFKVTHASRYPSPVLSLGISPDCGLLAVGMADGMLSIRKHDRPKAIKAGGIGAAPQRRQRYKPQLTAANYRYFIRGQSERAAADDFKVAARRKAKLQPYDRMLRSFRCAAVAPHLVCCAAGGCCLQAGVLANGAVMCAQRAAPANGTAGGSNTCGRAPIHWLHRLTAHLKTYTGLHLPCALTCHVPLCMIGGQVRRRAGRGSGHTAARGGQQPAGGAGHARRAERRAGGARRTAAAAAAGAPVQAHHRAALHQAADQRVAPGAGLLRARDWHLLAGG